MKAPQIIHRGVGKTCLTFHGICGRRAYPHGDVVIRLRRAGRREYEIEYPADIDGEDVCFTWGELMYNLHGRYIGDVYEDDKPVGMVQFQVNPAQWAAEIEDTKECLPAPPPCQPCP